MLLVDHIDEFRYLAFYRRWDISPELASDVEFDDIQIHLLECNECSAMARNCELRFRKAPQLSAAMTVATIDLANHSQEILTGRVLTPNRYCTSL